MFGGEVESLSVAEVEGVGVRVIVDGRQGFAWAGSLDADVIAETLAEARDNAALRRARRVRTGSPTPADVDGVDPPTLDLWRDDAARATPTDDKVALALELERGDAGRRPAHPRRRVGALRRRRGRGRGGELARRRGVDPAHGVLVLGVRDGRRRHRAPRPATASRPGAARRARPRTSRRTTPPSGPSGCSARSRSRRRACRWSSTRWSPARCSALLGGALNGEAVLKGRSLFAGRDGRGGRRPRRHSGRRPDDSPTRSVPPPTTARASRRAGTRSSPTACFERFLHNVYTARRRRRGARPGPPCAAGSSRRPASARARCTSCRVTLSAEEILASVGRRRSTCSR